MAITLLTQKRANGIEAQINNNHRNAITGEILAANILTLNTDLFSGEIATDKELDYAMMRMTIEGQGVLLGDWKAFVEEWWNGGAPEYPNTYLCDLNRKVYFMLKKADSDVCRIQFLLNTVDDLEGFDVDMAGGTRTVFNEIYRNAPRMLTLYLPTETTQYAGEAAMREDLSVTAPQLNDLRAGRYAFVKNMTGGNETVYPVIYIDSSEVIAGISAGGWGTELYQITRSNQIIVTII